MWPVPGSHLHNHVEGSWQTSLGYQTLCPIAVFWPILWSLFAINTSHLIIPFIPTSARIWDRNPLPSSLPELVVTLSITCILCQSHHKSALSSIWQLILLPKPSLVAGMGWKRAWSSLGLEWLTPLGRAEVFVLGCGGAVAAVVGNTALLCSLALASKTGVEGMHSTPPPPLQRPDRASPPDPPLPCPFGVPTIEPWSLFPVGAGDGWIVW